MSLIWTTNDRKQNVYDILGRGEHVHRVIPNGFGIPRDNPAPMPVIAAVLGGCVMFALMISGLFYWLDKVALWLAR